MDYSTFEGMARAAGLEAKAYYTLTEVARATGIPRSTVGYAVKKGRLKSFMPVGCRQGVKCRCDWVDEWLRDGERVCAG